MKADKFNEATKVYSKIINDYTGERTESGLPLELHSKLQNTECYSRLGEKSSAISSALTVFEDLLAYKWNLNESQFKTYASIVNEQLTGLLSNNTGISTEYLSQFELCKKRYQFKIEQWQIINNIKSNIAPELSNLLQANSFPSSPFEFSKRIGNEDYLVSAVMIPGSNQQDIKGILGH